MTLETNGVYKRVVEFSYKCPSCKEVVIEQNGNAESMKGLIDSPAVIEYKTECPQCKADIAIKKYHTARG